MVATAPLNEIMNGQAQDSFPDSTLILSLRFWELDLFAWSPLREYAQPRSRIPQTFDPELHYDLQIEAGRQWAQIACLHLNARCFLTELSTWLRKGYSTAGRNEFIRARL